MNSLTSHHHKQRGFTIVELLIVIVVIAILAAVSIVAYNGIQQRAVASQLTSAATQGAKAVKLYQAETGSYPANLNLLNNGQGLPSSSGISYRYTATATTFCLTATNDSRFFMTTETTAATEGSCVNVALGATVSGVSGSPRVTDGDLNTNNWIAGSAMPTSVATVDFGSVYPISLVKIWHYYGDGRTYHNTKTEVSANGTAWTTIFDSSNQGEYVETASGKAISFPTQSVRYIRDQSTGNTSNTSNHWVEIQAF